MNVVVESIPARLGGVLTYTRELARRLPRSFAPEGITLVAPPEAVPLDAGPLRWLRPRGSLAGLSAILATAPAIHRALAARPQPALFASANFTLQPRSFPQLVLLRNAIYFDPLYAEHVLPKVPQLERLGTLLRRALCLSSAEVAAHVLAPSEAMRALVVRARPDLEGRVEACHYGVDVAQYRIDSARRVPSAPGSLRIVAHSLIARHKPMWPILVGVLEARRRGVRARLTMLDTPFDPGHDWTPGIDDDRRLARRGLEEGWLSVLGRVPHERMPSLLAEHDAFAFHTLTESFGQPFVEAMASGLASVVSDTAVARELCGDAAMVVPLFDGRAFADRFEQLATDVDLRARLGVRGIARVEALDLTWDRHFERVGRILRALSQGAPIPPRSP